jgi:hypothetical protein
VERRLVLHQPGPGPGRGGDAAALALLPADAPRWPESGGRVKISAAWLIEKAGFARGYGVGQAQVSGKHSLALTNRGGATTEDLLALAREIRDGVRDRFGGRSSTSPSWSASPSDSPSAPPPASGDHEGSDRLEPVRTFTINGQ